jgi:hypothetical protein
LLAIFSDSLASSGNGNKTVYFKVKNSSGVESAVVNDSITLNETPITVTFPNGGESWQAGSTQTIKWTYTGDPGPSVKIELLKGTSVNSTITSNTSIGSNGSGSYNWTIPTTQTTGSDYKIRITSTSNSSYTDTSDGNFTISGDCKYSIFPTSQSFDADGGSGSVSVTASSTCSWTATSNASWVTIISGSNGSGDGTVIYNVDDNTSTSQRTGTMTIANNIFTVTQKGTDPCTYSLVPESRSHGSGAETGSFDVKTNSSICSWLAYSDVSWITITSGSSGMGDGTVYYSVAANTSSSLRTGTITVYGAYSYIFTVTQSGMSTTQIERITNGSFSSGSSGWNLSGDFWAGTNLPNWRTSPGYAAGGVDSGGLPKDGAIGNMYQTVTIPSNATKATLSFWYNITSDDSTTTSNDFLNVTIQNATGTYLSTVAFLSNLNESSLKDYRQINYDVTSYRGQTIRINFFATTNSSYNTNTVFRIDDVSLMSDGN